jgi:phospholipid-binding lipoprotein MlaA
MKAWKQSLLAAACLLGSACASMKGDDPRDPWEGVNRGVYRFNETFDEWLAKPVARTYVKVLHEEIRSRIANFFSNLGDPLIGANNFLQGKFTDGVNDWARFAFNSTFGLLGIHDVASEWGFEKHNEDFGQTFGRWGAGTGPYLILPLLGSSTVRDGLGTGADMVLDPMGEIRPINLRNSLIVVRATNLRADFLEASRILEEAALDKYVFQRDAYLQRRRSLVYDGRPPREKLE